MTLHHCGEQAMTEMGEKVLGLKFVQNKRTEFIYNLICYFDLFSFLV